MKKRMFKALFIIGIIVCFSSPGLAKEKVIKWKVQGFVPAGMLFHDVLLHLADEVKKATDGRLIWQIFPSGALVPPFEGVKAVSDGVYQVNYGYAAQWVGKIPGSVAPLFNSIPGGFNFVDMQMWLEHGGGKELHQEMFDRNGFKVKLFHGPPISMENFMWSKKPLRKLEDFKGLKMRMMPLMGDVLARNGFSVVFMPAGEIMPNLQRGVITAMESKNLEAVEFFKEKGVETVIMDPEAVATMVKWAHEYLDELAGKDEFFARVWNSQKAFGKRWYPYIKAHNLPH
jgi:TRAP-type mannitol/chloroaromatic compound transport system substrate-binding protein